MARPQPKRMERAPRKEHPYEPSPAVAVAAAPAPASSAVETPRPSAPAPHATFSSRINPEIKQEFKVQAAQRGMSVQDALTEAMTNWLKT